MHRMRTVAAAGYRRRKRTWLVLPLLLLALAPSIALAQTPPRVLTDQTGPELERAFSALPGGATLSDAQIRGAQVDAKVCASAGPCAEFVLSDPQQACKGERTRTFCLVFRGEAGPLHPVVRNAVEHIAPTVWQIPLQRAAVSPWPERRVWLQMGLFALMLALLLLAGRGGPALGVALGVLAVGAYGWAYVWRADDRAWPARMEFAPLGWEAIWWLLPMTVGLVAAACGRRWPSRRRWCLILPASVAALPLVWPALVPGDALPMAIIALLVARWQGDVAPQRALRWSVALMVSLLGIGGLELVLRMGSPPPAVEDARQILLRPAPALADEGTRAAWTDTLFTAPAHFKVLRARPPQSPWLLHLGDSMLFGAGIAEARAVPAQLAPLLPGVAQVNAGVPGSSIDLQYAFLERLLKLWPAPLAVVLHVYPGNDLSGLDQALEICGGRPVLTAPQQPVAVACQSAAPPPLLQSLLHTPLPLPLARAAQWSWLARRLAVAHQQLQVFAEPADDAGAARRYRQIASALQRRLQEKGIRLVVAFMPGRAGPHGVASAAADQLHAVFADLQVPQLDTQRVFAEQARQGLDAALFVSASDPHLSQRGAALYAATLAPWLQTALHLR